MSYMTISSENNFSLCSCFHAHPTTLLLKILGGPMHGRSPHLKFWGTVPPVLPRSPPLDLRTLATTMQVRIAHRALHYWTIDQCRPWSSSVKHDAQAYRYYGQNRGKQKT